jgi:hypothetical protein
MGLHQGSAASQSFFCALVALGLTSNTPSATANDFALTFPTASRDARSWLTQQGFRFLQGSTSSSRLSLGDRGLKIELLTGAEMLFAKEGLSVAQPARLSVRWGVERFPDGANWNSGVNREAVMVIVQFGTERLSGGFLPARPYFIGFFLCQNERRGFAYTGRSYTQQGRYICVDKPAAGAEVTSTLNLDDQFRAAFKTSGPVPAVTGVGVEADTSGLGVEGRASAWIRSIAITRR